MINSTNSTKEISTRQPSRKQLRKELRTHRRALSPTQQRQASLGVVRQLATMISFIKASKLGFYWPSDGEVDITAIATNSGQSWYLPVVSDSLRPWEPTRLFFQAYDEQTIMVHNKYNIIEPGYDPRALINPQMLDLVCLPLVGFDRRGNRLGMGKGYYDRTFAKRSWKKTLLVGIAHSSQERQNLTGKSWDIPLQAIVTERELIWC